MGYYIRSQHLQVLDLFVYLSILMTELLGPMV